MTSSRSRPGRARGSNQYTTRPNRNRSRAVSAGTAAAARDVHELHHLIRDLFAGVGGSVQDGSAWFDYGGVEFDLELSEDQVRMLEHVTGSSSRSPSGD